MPVGFVPFSEGLTSAMLSQHSGPPPPPPNPTDAGVSRVALVEMRRTETDLRPVDYKRICKASCRRMPCFLITFVAFTALFCVSLEQVNRIGKSHYELFLAEANALGNNTAAIASLTDAFNADNRSLMHDFGPPLAAGIANLCFTPMYISSLGGTTGDPTSSTTMRIARVGITLLGAGTVVAGGFATAAGLTVGGPIMVAVGACSLITGVIPLKNSLEIRRKIDAAVCSIWSRVSSCFRGSNSEI